MIDAFWFVMTPLAFAGWLAIKRGHPVAGPLLLMGYAGCNLLSLGHYLYAPLHAISGRIHAFILLESFLAVALLCILARTAFARHHARHGSDVNCFDANDRFWPQGVMRPKAGIHRLETIGRYIT
ncbi:MULTISPECIES: hypothetical protein [Stenotrophomonas]|uniref:hypothetical protein n=1 Tax=Stenotrophomonas TaxID=40323 RepID=UPI00076FF602|nr:MULTISPECIES: hypothetical protein [Stenotrophomonas]AMJ56603.1 hypothetical protein AXG53_08035 [Stenotrophomonas sp. KCTC 12332]